MKKLYNTLWCLFGMWAVTWCVSLENWRNPFYRIAVEQGEYSSSPSGLFWDDMGYVSILDSSLWPDSSKYNQNHWTIEPSITQRFSNQQFLSNKKSNFHLDVFSDFKYKRLAVRTMLEVDQQNKYNPDFVWKKDRFAAGRIEEAYAQYTADHGFVRFGRINRNWGPFYDRSILLSNNPFTYDALEWQFYTSFLEFRHLFASLPGGVLNRYLAAHTLNFMFGKWGAIGVSETLLFGRSSQFPDLAILNPFSIYTVINTNGEGGGNLMLGFQGWCHPFTPNITLKAQIILDDFQVDDVTVADKEPTHWAADYGFYWTEPFPIPLNHHISVEYRYLSRWIYTVTPQCTEAGEQYVHLTRSLGYQDIDGDFFRGAITVAGSNFWAASLGMSITRKDTNTIFTPWPSDIAIGYTDEIPLSQRTHLTTTLNCFLDINAYFNDYINVNFNLENRWIKKRHEGNTYTYDPRVSFAVSVHYSDLFLLFDRNKKKLAIGDNGE